MRRIRWRGALISPEIAVVAADVQLIEQRLAVVIRAGAEVHRARAWDALHPWLAHHPARAVVVGDPYVGVPDRSVPADGLKDAIARYPLVAFIGMVDTVPGPQWLHAIPFSDLLVREYDSGADALQIRLARARDRPLRRMIAGVTPVEVSGSARAIVEAAASELISGTGTAAGIGEKLGASQRTLLRWCRGAGLPAPRRMLAWLRVFVAATLIRNGSSPLEAIALESGFRSLTAMGTAVRRYTGFRPRDLRVPANSSAVMRAFVRAMFRQN